MRGLRQIEHAHVNPELAVSVDFFKALPCHPRQQAFVSATHCALQYFLGGIGTGKTRALAMKGLYNALIQPGTPHGLLARTGRDLTDVVLPTFWEVVDQWLRATGINIVESWSASERRLALVNGSSIIFRPYDQVNKIRGLNLATIGADEIEYCLGDPAKSYEVLTGRARVGEPRLRQAYCSSTPNGLRGVVQKFYDYQQQGLPCFLVQSTMFDNPWVFDDEDCHACRGSGRSADGRCDRCHGVGLASTYIDTQRAALSARQWAQEGEGRILTPATAVFGGSFDEHKHVIPWEYDPSLKWVLCVDWGEAHAYFCAAQVTARDTWSFGQKIPAGSWIVFAERKMELTSRPAFRRAIVDFIRHGKLGRQSDVPPPGDPYWSGSDRAVKSENSWLKRLLPYTICRWCTTYDQITIRNGIGMMESMLDPEEGLPRLYFSESLPSPVGKDEAGLRKAMLGYSYIVDWHSKVPTNAYDKDDVHDHPIDALRYGIVTSAREPALHGGAWLPYILGAHTRG